jgi:hypothetical protein
MLAAGVQLDTKGSVLDDMACCCLPGYAVGDWPRGQGAALGVHFRIQCHAMLLHSHTDHLKLRCSRMIPTDTGLHMLQPGRAYQIRNMIAACPSNVHFKFFDVFMKLGDDRKLTHE